MVDNEQKKVKQQAYINFVIIHLFLRYRNNERVQIKVAKTGETGS